METVKMMIELPKETYNMIKNFSNWNSSQVVIEDIEKAIQSSASLNECIECDDAIKQLLSVTPQEPFKPMVEIDLYSVIKQKYIEREVLDKIREEIMGYLKALDDIEKINIFLPNEMTGRRLTYQQCLGFIDKYKAETEVE